MESSGVDSSSSPSPSVDRDGNLAHASDESPPPPSLAFTSPPRVKLMVSYGGRIQPRPHDNTRLCYVGGETKILAIDRSSPLSALLAKLASIAPFPLCLKYQLPGEDLDALVSVTDDDDLEHMMVEYDRLRSSSPKPGPRLRLFLFPIGPPPPPPSAALLDAARRDTQWFLDALNAAPAPSPPPILPSPLEALPSPDFLFGFDQGFVPLPAVKVARDPQPPLVLDDFDPPEKPDLTKDEQVGGGAPAVVSTSEIKQQIPELHGLQISDNPPPVISRNSSEEALARFYSPDYETPRAPEKTAPVAWLEQQSGGTVGRYASLAAGHNQTVYLLPASPGMYPGFYAAASTPGVAMACAQVSAKAVAGGGGMGAVGGGGKLAYDSTGRMVYYASVVPTYQTITSVALNPVDAAVKAAANPSRVS